MTTEIYLDPNEVAPLEPSEGDAHNQESISPFAIPDAIVADVRDDGTVSRIRFRYPGGETAESTVPLDEESDPFVFVRAGRYTGAVLELKMSPPTDIEGLRHIASRIKVQATTLPNDSKRFAYMIIASIMRKWATNIVG